MSADGNLTGNGSYTYQYDANGHMVKVLQGTSTYATLTYNAMGWMANWTLPGNGTSQDLGYLPNGQVEGAFNGNGGSNWWYEQYLWLGQRLLAYYNPDWNTYFIHRGANGSSTQITDQGGGLAGDMLFYPFGQEWAYDNGVNASWWQFYNSFSRWSADLGFDLTPNRKYSPALGRWMTPDPSGMAAASPSNPQTWNLYAYVLNNPTSLIDTSGLTCIHTDSGETVDNMDGKGCAAMNHNPEDVNVSAQLPVLPTENITVSAQAPLLPTYQEGSTAGQAAPSGMPGGQAGVGGGGAFGGGSAARPGLSHEPTPTGCSTGSPDNHLSVGDQVDAAGVNPFTSRGGGIWGGNKQSFPAATHNYTYSGKGVGLDVGVSVQSAWAWGRGNWSGPFHSVNWSLGVFSGSVFWTPGKGGWIGFSFGLGLGLPGVAYEETNYTCKSGGELA